MLNAAEPLVIEAEVLLGQVYSLDDEETDTQYHWSVTLALRLGKQNNRLQTFLLSEAGMTPERILRGYPDLDEVYALNTDLSQPLIFVSLRGKDVLIDGWHRAYLASISGVDELLAYFLTEDEGNECLLFRLPKEKALDWGQPSSENTERKSWMTSQVGSMNVPQTSREAILLLASTSPPLPHSERKAKVSGTLRAYLFDRENFLARLEERAETLHQNGYLAWATNGSGAFAVTFSLKEGERSYLVHAVDRTCTCPFYTKQLEEEPLTEDGTFVECKHLRGLGKLVVKSGEMHKRCEDWKSYYALRTHWIGTIAERRRRELGLAPCSCGTCSPLRRELRRSEG